MGTTYASLAGWRGGSDVFVRKYTVGGLVSWTKQFGTTDYEQAGGVAAYGNSLYVVGTVSRAVTEFSKDALIRKYNSNGSFLWARQFGTSRADYAADVAVDSSGNAYVVGLTNGPLGRPSSGEYEVFIRRYNANGSVAWTKQLPYTVSSLAQAVAVSGSNVYFVFAYETGSTEYADVRVIKYTSSGRRLWNKGFGSSDGGNDIVHDASADGNGVVFAGDTTGTFSGTNQGDYDGYVYKLNSSGNKIWGGIKAP